MDDHYNLAIWVTQSLEELQSGVARMAARAGQGPISIVWPKKASKAASDLSQQSVREVGLAAGLVDRKRAARLVTSAPEVRCVPLIAMSIDRILWTDGISER